MFKSSYLINVCLPDKKTVFGLKCAGDYIKWEILTINVTIMYNLRKNEYPSIFNIYFVIIL